MQTYRPTPAFFGALLALACNARAPQAPPPPASPPPPIVTTSAPPLPPPPPPIATVEPIDAGNPVDAAPPDPNARKHELEGKVFSGRANADEVHELMGICIKQADRTCIERVVGVAR